MQCNALFLSLSLTRLPYIVFFLQVFTFLFVDLSFGRYLHNCIFLNGEDNTVVCLYLCIFICICVFVFVYLCICTCVFQKDTCTIVSSSMERIRESDFRTQATVFRPTCFTLFSNISNMEISSNI